MSDKKGHGESQTHGHGHKLVKPSEPTNKKQGKIPKGSSKPNKPKKVDPPEEKRKNGVTSVTEKDTTVMHSGEETVYVPHDKLEKKLKAEEREKDEEKQEKQRRKETVDHNELKNDRKEYKKSNVTPENFNTKEFNTNLTEFIRTLDDPRYSKVDSDYPVEDLTSLVNMITKSVNHYKVHSSDTQKQLDDLRESMRQIKESLHFSITRQALNLKTDDEHQTQEERELYVKLTKLNAALAQANHDVTEAIRLATETETTAVMANIAAERARAEAEKIKEEADKKKKAEQKRKEEERERMEEMKRQKEEEERRVREEEERKEQEWKRMEAIQSGKYGQVYETWQPVEYQYTNEQGETEITCMARGQPGVFEKRHVICKVANEKEALVTYQPNEELISNVVDLTSADGESELKSPIYVAIPHVLSRTGAQSREPVVKAMTNGEWKDLPTRDVTFDNHKDIKFAQAEVHHLTTLLIMSRLKRDYFTLTPNKNYKITSSFDQRITFTIEKSTFSKLEHLLLQVQPVDSTTFQEFRARQPEGKRLLTCSPVVHTQWDSVSFGKPIEVTVSCPTNPAKAKKLALARKLKEEKLKNPTKKPVPIEQQKETKEQKKMIVQEVTDVETAPVKLTKWYMGDYGHSDDDETDQLHFVYMQGGKWVLDPEMVIKQSKIDVLLFRLEFPVERFMVLRTRTSIEDAKVVQLAVALNEYLGKRFVEAFVRQKSDNPCVVVLQATPVSRRDAVVKQLAQQGFESGPGPTHVLCLQEGDMVEVGFSGNIECTDHIPEYLIYKSNIPTLTFFTVKEENKFRQKEQDVYSGSIQLTRLYAVTPNRGKKVQGQVVGQGQAVGQGQNEGTQQQPEKEWKREKLCTIQITIPKYHVEPNTEPIKAPVTIASTSGPVDNELLMALASSLGDEWKLVAHYLGVHRARVQAIMRNVTVGERSEMDAKYEMLVTWLKGAAKALDKVSALSSALMYSDRYDLAEAVQERHRDFTELKRGQMATAN